MVSRYILHQYMAQDQGQWKFAVNNALARNTPTDHVHCIKREWAGLKWHPVFKVWEQLQDKHSKEMQNLYR